MTEKRRSHAFSYAYAASLTLLLGLVVDKLFLRPSIADAEDYHSRMQEAVARLPAIFGDWMGLDAPVPEAAVRLLHPNAIVSRRYQNLKTGESVMFLLVQVHDARDILGHYPPVCYPAQGWVAKASTDKKWGNGPSAVSGMEYIFSRDRLDGANRLNVSNFLFLPGGQTCRVMSEIEAAAQSRLRKAYGAGQVQIVSEGLINPERQDEIVQEFLGIVNPITQTPVSMGGT